MLEQAITATKSLDHKALADYLRKNEMKTIVGPITLRPGRRVGATRAWCRRSSAAWPTRTSEQFRQAGKQVVIYPDAYKTGDVIAPFEKAREVGALAVRWTERARRSPRRFFWT